jgi:cell division transport system permease protein
MTLGRALAYFLREACVSLVRSWQASAVAVFTVTVSLFVSGFFLLATDNLAEQARSWQREVKVVVYLVDDVDPLALPEDLERLARSPPWLEELAPISVALAAERFAEAFPDLADALGEAPLPASLELVIASDAPTAEVEAWENELRNHALVAMVDDDRDWLRTLSRIVVLARGVGIALGLGLLITAALTTASVVRLAAYQYLDEIAVLRLVGATEFFIRGPFYVQGLLQGALGGAVALVLLLVAQQLLLGRFGDSIWISLVAQRFLGWQESALMIGTGAGAGLFGALLSLRRETLRSEEA